MSSTLGPEASSSEEDPGLSMSSDDGEPSSAEDESSESESDEKALQSEDVRTSTAIHELKASSDSAAEASSVQHETPDTTFEEADTSEEENEEEEGVSETTGNYSSAAARSGESGEPSSPSKDAFSEADSVSVASETESLRKTKSDVSDIMISRMRVAMEEEVEEEEEEEEEEESSDEEGEQEIRPQGLELLTEKGSSLASHSPRASEDRPRSATDVSPPPSPLGPGRGGATPDPAGTPSAADLETGRFSFNHERTRRPSVMARAEMLSRSWTLDGRGDTGISDAAAAAAVTHPAQYPESNGGDSTPATPSLSRTGSKSWTSSITGRLTRSLTMDTPRAGDSKNIKFDPTADLGAPEKPSRLRQRRMSMMVSTMESRLSHLYENHIQQLLNPYADRNEWTIIYHDGRFRERWDQGIGVLVLYTAFMDPYQISFGEQSAISCSYSLNWLDAIDLFMDLIFIAHIFINFRTTYKDPLLPNPVTDRRAIAMHYLRGSFALDFIASLPISQMINIYATIDCGSTKHLQAGSSIRLIRLMRLTRLLRLHNLPPQAAMSIYLSLFSNCLYYLMTAHWIGCTWHMMMKEAGYPNDSNFYLPHMDQAGEVFLYMRSLFWGLSMLSGMGAELLPDDDTPQVLLSIAVLVAGITLFLSVIGNITNIFQKMDTTTTRYRERLDFAAEFMKTHNLPRELQGQVRDYLDQEWQQSKGLDEGSLLSSLPRSIALDIRLHLCKDLLSGVPLFTRCDDFFIWALLEHLRPSVAIPGMTVLRAGELVSHVYFLASGTCNIEFYSKIIRRLNQGSVFGATEAIGMTKSHKKTAVVAAKQCQMYLLSVHDLNAVIEKCPSVKKHFREEAAAVTIQSAWKHRLIINCLRQHLQKEELLNSAAPGSVRKSKTKRIMSNMMDKIDLARKPSLMTSSGESSKTATYGHSKSKKERKTSDLGRFAQSVTKVSIANSVRGARSTSLNSPTAKSFAGILKNGSTSRAASLSGNDLAVDSRASSTAASEPPARTSTNKSLGTEQGTEDIRISLIATRSSPVP